MAEAKYAKSPSGYYSVQLNAAWEHEGFLYKPSHAVTVNEEVLKAALAAGVATAVRPA